MEKTLIEGKFSKANVLTIASVVISLCTLIYSIWWDRRIHSWGISGYHKCIEYYTPFWAIGIPLIILALVFHFWMSGCKITVTDKRVYGKAAFGKRVDLPFDMISSVGSGAFKSIAVATSSGKISFWLLANRDEVFDTISQTLLLRQETKKASTTTTIKQEVPQSNADELKKYKELLDSGIISQEEFDAKKKQLLGL